MSKRFGFMDLLAPIETEQFFRHHWEQKPLFVHREQMGYYDALLSLEKLEEHISSSGIRYPALCLVRDGVYLPVESYTTELRWERDTFSGLLEVAKVAEEFQRGATVVLQAAHMSLPPLRDACVEMEQSLGHRAHANVYLTPPETNGFFPHYDTHDVFVLQIAGKKHWQVYCPTVELPDRSMPFRGDRSNLGTYEAFTLTPGDMLYLPRGYVHGTSTSQLISLHVTLGVDIYSWFDFLQEALYLARQDPAFRRALPTGMLLSKDGADPETYAGVIEDMFRRFGQHATPRELISFLKHLIAYNTLSSPAYFDAGRPRSSR